MSGCKVRVFPANSFSGHMCPRPAGEDGLCGSHRAGERRRQQSQSARQAEYDAHDRQQRFVRNWRAEHPLDVYGATWTCPLCGKVIQAAMNENAHNRMVSELAEKHQRFHGDDWTAYTHTGGQGAASEGGRVNDG